ncbi:PQQ-binding-like beta-propeller repeat protein (plasmid) [Haladaptatus sp. SPP-AMP-3]|uniref:outer membrane protein assembly factor BamB family protein n=1 Tax=Haladaptatus sp. SPP-AMP-3 TaxID=3121295 RepID=UPI003C2FA829
MNPSPSSLSRRGFLTTTGTLGAAVGVGGATTTTTGTTTFSDDAPKPAWTIPESPEDSDPRYEAAYPITVADGIAVVIVISDSTESTTYQFRGLDESDGTERWTKEFPGISLPVIDDDSMYFYVRNVRNDTDSEGAFVALDLKTGDERWRKSTDTSSRWTAVGGGNVYRLSSDDRFILALDAESGKQVWSYQATQDDMRAVSFQFANDTLYTSFNDAIYAFAPDGTKRWQNVETGLMTLYVRSVTDSHLYATEGSSLYAFDVEDGSRDWSVESQGQPVEKDGVLYSWGPDLKAIDVEDGSVQWQYDDVGRTRAEPVVADGAVFGVDREGTVSAITTDGTERWTFDMESTEEYSFTTLNVSDGSVYVSFERTLYVLSTDDGSLQWSFTGENRAINTILADDVLLFGTRGTLYAFDRHHSLLSTAVDGTGEFLTSGPGMALSGILVGTTAFAAYRRWNDDDEAVTADATEPTLEYGRLDRLASDALTESYRVRKRTDDGPEVVVERHLTDPQVAGTFRSAAERWAEMSDRPGVVPVLETDGDSVELPYYADGSLADSHRSVEERLDALSNANTVVHDAHSDGVIHGGLTPKSILLDGDDVAVGDWELVAALAEFRDRSPYDAPEQVAGEADDERTDVYRLGAIAAFVLTGEDPDGGSLRMLDPEYRKLLLARADPNEYESLRSDSVSPELYEVISKAMADDPDDRFESVVAFDDMLRWAAFRA